MSRPPGPEGTRSAPRGIEWDVFVKGLHDALPSFLANFVRLRMLARDAGDPALVALISHEQAINAFAELELAGNADCSLAVLGWYLEARPRAEAISRCSWSPGSTSCSEVCPHRTVVPVIGLDVEAVVEHERAAGQRGSPTGDEPGDHDREHEDRAHSGCSSVYVR